MTDEKLIADLRAEIEALRERVAELEARPHVEHHQHHHYAPLPIPNPAPAPFSPFVPYCEPGPTFPVTPQPLPGTTAAPMRPIPINLC